MELFDFYGEIASSDCKDTTQNGRYLNQQESEQFILPDIVEKLKIDQNDTVLDVGCGSGLYLVPLSKHAKNMVGIDHDAVIKRLKKKTLPENLELISGNFLEIDLDQEFHKIIVYSVLHALPSEETVISFIDQALECLRADGMMMLGDLPNIDKKHRFLKSERGRIFQEKWINSKSTQDKEDPIANIDQKYTQELCTFDDRFVGRIIQHIRTKGFHGYLVDQSPLLPFGNTREDIIVVGPEYDESKNNHAG